MAQINSPYETPKSELSTEPAHPVEIYSPVSRWLRLANFVIDYVVMLILVVAVFFLIGLTLSEEAAIEFQSIVDSTPDFVFGIVMFIAYYLPLESLTGRTPGKLITGTRVVTEEGLRPSLLQILGRTLARLVPFEPLSFFRSEGLGWHDTWSNTQVVKAR